MLLSERNLLPGAPLTEASASVRRFFFFLPPISYDWWHSGPYF